MSYTDGSPVSDKSRFISGAKVISLLGVFFTVGSIPTAATTYFDTDIYGDKELKIATVNKIKQKLRNAILQDPAVAPSLLKLSISDGLGYDAKTGSGGQDGSIYLEISKENGDKDLETAIKILQGIQKELQRTNRVGFGDLVAFGGAEALESVGCGRVVVQVGRYEVKVPNPEYTPVKWDEDNLTISNIKPAFSRSGLNPQQIALLLGALGEVTRVTTEAASIKKEEEEDDEFEEQPFVPSTFGSRDAMYGAKVGKADFGSKYLLSLLKGKGPQDALSKILLDDPQVKTFVQKYATNEGAFVKDVPEAYLRLTNVGQEFTTRNS
eukprot:CAMPEP_0182432028 /NCGR_PEP_ID=MMETSP1167-20130531/53435_1 /TAXON_ID=2988 /ORGANISM="Mallomonas Sp, Strain CCMP3275" /LENGTH=323 /DNA_ID=CAMNT_0024619057 /DNA_START=110 /DNA_END=1081 /DNA_ORIENTATION=+